MRRPIDTIARAVRWTTVVVNRHRDINNKARPLNIHINGIQINAIIQITAPSE